MKDYQDVVTALCGALEAEEGYVPWMYLDTSGVVTIGNGHALFTPEDAVALPWDFAADSIRMDWGRVKRAERGNFAAGHYRSLTRCRLADEEIKAVLADDVTRFISQVEHAYPAFGTFPAGPQQAVLDLAFNCGTAGLRKKFPACHEAIVARDWTVAAASCRRRPPISDRRNELTRALFLRGVGVVGA